jgi:hypothetical protein
VSSQAFSRLLLSIPHDGVYSASCGDCVYCFSLLFENWFRPANSFSSSCKRASLSLVKILQSLSLSDSSLSELFFLSPSLISSLVSRLLVLEFSTQTHSLIHVIVRSLHQRKEVVTSHLVTSARHQVTVRATTCTQTSCWTPSGPSIATPDTPIRRPVIRKSSRVPQDSSYVGQKRGEKDQQETDHNSMNSVLDSLIYLCISFLSIPCLSIPESVPISCTTYLFPDPGVIWTPFPSSFHLSVC